MRKKKIEETDVKEEKDVKVKKTTRKKKKKDTAETTSIPKMSGKYLIECRYQYMSRDGIDWTKWHPYWGGYNDKESVDNEVNRLNESNKKDKMKHEFRVVEVGDNKDIE